MTHDEDNSTGIAIIGMSGRFPGAQSVAEFWQNLCDGRESITRLDENTLLSAGVEASALEDPSYVRAAPLLEGIELFDAGLFDMTPAEASQLDPQQRLFLECAWEALEQGGYRIPGGELSVGVYGSAMISGYLLNNLQHLPAMQRARNGLNMSTLQVLFGNDRTYLSTRVGFKLDLQGPCCTVQSACSSSLLAVHMACQALLAGECDMALAGGSSIRVPQHVGYYHEPGSIVSKDGHCRAFDARGDGTVFGSGVGVVLLRPLAEALASKDHIWAVIRGSAANNDGALKMGFSAPSVEAQSRVIEEAINVASVPADSIGYVEAHGTGTHLGDPVEIAALTRAFRRETQRQQYCPIGSVKTNIGHAEGASGVAGLIKTTLALFHEQIPATLHFESPNPQLSLETSPFFVNTTLRPWPKIAGAPRRAGVTSLGVGGTNVHVVLEEAPRPAPQSERATRPWHLLTLSAQSLSSLDAGTQMLSTFLKAHPEVDVTDVAYTLNVGRAALHHRRIVVCRDSRDARAVLANEAPSRVWTRSHERANPPVIFMFPGQGSQYSNMGQGLLETEPVFQRCVNECAALLQTVLQLDIRDYIYPDAIRSEEADARLAQTAITQPALFTVEYALARTWMARGVTPSAMMGHSVGELVAACLAGVFTLKDALELVALRGRLVQALPPGEMLSISLSAAQVRAYVTDDIGVAAVNEANRCVVSGPSAAIRACASRLEQSSIDHRLLRTSHAFHSAMLDPVLDQFAEAVGKVERRAPGIRCLSNVTGTWLTDEQACDPRYWTAQMRQPVRFADNLVQVFAEGPSVLLEVGPGRSLCRFAKAHPGRSSEHAFVSSMRHVMESSPDVEVLLNAMGQLWLTGVALDWKDYWGDEPRRRIPLPTYCFERQRHWIDPVLVQTAPTRALEEAVAPGTQTRTTTTGVAVTAGAPRPDISTAYAPPTTATEALMVEMWGDLLGIQDVGIYDNFLELGGDSLLGVQLASRANAQGIRLSPKHLFDYPNIADLSAVIDSGLARKVMVREEAQGPQPLLPIQTWLMERMPEFRTWVKVITCTAREPLDLTDLELALDAVCRRHSSLRTRFEARSTGWVQEVMSDPAPSRILRFELPDSDDEDLEARLDTCAKQASRCIDISQGKLIQAGVLRAGDAPEACDRLVVAIHHWAVDLAGESILMRDLESAYAQTRARQPTQLPPVATSMAAFSAFLVERARQQAADVERGEWLRQARSQVRPLPWRRWDATRSPGDVVTIVKALGAAETSRLLHGLQRARRVSLEEIAVSAVASAFADWSEERNLLMDIEMSARHSDLPGVDLTRSIGWFTTICPLLVEFEAAPMPLTRLDATVHAMRGLRQREHEYGMLRYLSPDPSLRERLARLPRAEIFFGYFGEVNASGTSAAVDEEALFRLDPVANARQRSMLGAFRYAVEVAAYLSAGRLHLAWLFNERLLAREEAVALAESSVSALCALADVPLETRRPALEPRALAGAIQSELNLGDVLAELRRGSLLECD